MLWVHGWGDSQTPDPLEPPAALGLSGWYNQSQVCPVSSWVRMNVFRRPMCSGFVELTLRSTAGVPEHSSNPHTYSEVPRASASTPQGHLAHWQVSYTN